MRGDGSSKNQSRLVNKRMLVGMEKSAEFHKKREALIEKHYAAEEIGQRILNGGGWIKEPYDEDTICQLDRFHIHQEIKKKLKEKEVQEEVWGLLEQERLDELFEYLRIYADSVASEEETDTRRENALKLYEYLWNNREGLCPIRKEG